MATVIDSYDTSNQDNYAYLYAGSQIGGGQCFTGNGYKITSAKFYMKKGGSPTGTGVVKIYNMTGTFGTSGKPTGSALATSSTIDVSTITTSFALYEFTFTGVNQITLTNGTYYCVEFSYDGGDASNRLWLGYDSSSPTHAGNRFRSYSGSWDTQSGHDVIFYVYGDPATIGPFPTFFRS
jgi:hypothetical protein